MIIWSNGKNELSFRGFSLIENKQKRTFEVGYALLDFKPLLKPPPYYRFFIR